MNKISSTVVISPHPVRQKMSSTFKNETTFKRRNKAEIRWWYAVALALEWEFDLETLRIKTCLQQAPYISFDML